MLYPQLNIFFEGSRNRLQIFHEPTSVFRSPRVDKADKVFLIATDNTEMLFENILPIPHFHYLQLP